MKDNHFVEFDYLRTISIIGIVLCHCCYGWNHCGWVGSYLGETFNCVFLAISALLLGSSWHHRQYPQYSFSPFMKPRITRLLSSYYPFLIFMFLFILLSGGNVTIKNLITHLLFLPWFDKLSGFGHLWFLTIIVFCYILFYLISKINKRLFFKNRLIKLVILIAIISAQFVLNKFGLPGSLFVYLLFTGYLFINADYFIRWITTLEIKRIIPFYLIINIGAMILFYNGAFDVKIIFTWLGVFCAISQICLILKLFRNSEETKIITYISTISFEIYLIHHFLCFGKYSIDNNITQSYIGGFILMICITLIGAHLLHLLSDKVRYVLTPKKII